MRKRAGLVITAMATASLLAGWAAGSGAGSVRTQSPSSARAQVASGSLTMAIPTDPGKLDPHLTLLGAARTVGSFVYDSLITVAGPGKIQSGLARSWKVISAKRVQFTLRRGVTCSDGTPMNATVIKRNLDFIANPANKSPYLGVAVSPTATVTANNRAATLVVTTKVPNPFLIQSLSLVQIVCQRGLSNRSLLERGAVGSGPYRLVEAVSGDHYTFAVRSGYRWGPGGATTAAARLPARVTLRIIPNETTAANLMLTGGLNVAQIIGDERARLNARGLFRRVSIGSPLEFFFNQNPGHPAADATVRRAMIRAMNLRQIGTVATSGRGVRVTSLVRQDLTPCPGDTITGVVPAYSPSAARAVLAGRSPTLRLIYPTDAGAAIAPAMELALQQLSAAGVRVTLAGMTTAALQGALFGTGNWDAVLIGIGVSSPAQLIPFLSGPTIPRGTNFSNIDNSTYRTAVARANRRVGRAGCQYWLAGERALMREGDVAPSSALTVGVYGRNATFALDAGGVVPTSLRLTR